MSATDAAGRPLPSPPDSPSKEKEYQPFGLGHLADFNASNQGQYVHPIPDGIHSAYGNQHNDTASPEDIVVRAGQPEFDCMENFGSGEAYGVLDGPTDGMAYTNYPIPNSYSHYGDPEHFGNTPPVTPPAILEGGERRTRNSNLVSGTTKQQREQRKGGSAMGGVASRPRPKKPKEVKASKKKIEKPDDSPIDMPVPLFELLLDVPLVDAEAYIRRPKEHREEEWRNRRDFPKMPRPVNVFLLYRRAVSERAKKYAGVTNHQVVSKIAGASWKNESDRVKDIFNQFAELEKEYHDKAFPDYKFNPKKTQSTKTTKGKNKGEESDDQSNDDDDPEYTERTSTRRKKPKVEIEQVDGTEQNGPHTWQYASQYQFDPPSPMPNRLPYPTDPRYRPHGGHYGQVPTTYDPRFEIGELQETPQLGLLTTSVSTHIGLPGGNHDLLLGNTVPMEQSGHFDANSLDPNLFSFDSHDNGFFSGAFNNHDHFVPSSLEYTQEGEFLASPRQPREWELNEHETPMNSSEFGQVFDNVKD